MIIEAIKLKNAKNVATISFAILIILVMIFALFFVNYFSSPGIEVSCLKKEIIGFKKVPPPIMNIVQPIVCNVDINTSANGNKICSEKFQVTGTDNGVFPCKKLQNYKNQLITIEATFYDTDNQLIGKDSKKIEYEGL